MATKTLRNFQIVGALYSGVGEGAQEAQAGDSVRIFLNQVANPSFPVSIDGTLQPPVSAVNVLDSGGHVVEGRSYSISYDDTDIDGATLTACDITELSVISCCVVVSEALDAEIAARAASDAELEESIGGLQQDLDTWDVTEIDEEPVQGVSGVPQVVTQTMVGTILSSGTLIATVTGAGITGSPLAVPFQVDEGDVPSVSAAKAAAKLATIAAITALYTPSNIGSDFALTEITPNGGDGTLNIAITNGTATGLTPYAVSPETVAGVAEVVGTPADRVGQHVQLGDRIWEAISIDPNQWVELAIVDRVLNRDSGISGLNGGGASKLDGIAVSATDAGKAQVVTTSANTGYYLHVLTAGTAAEDTPHVIRPDNYDAGDNAFVWLWKPAFTNSASIIDASSGGNGADDEDLAVLYSLDGGLKISGSLTAYTVDGTQAIDITASGLTVSGTQFIADAAGVQALAFVLIPATPIAGFTIVASRYTDQIHFWTPAGVLATGAFTLPAAANARAGQIVRFCSTQVVTAMTVTVSGGGTILGTAITAAAIAANTPYAWQCVSTTGTGTWLRIQ